MRSNIRQNRRHLIAGTFGRLTVFKDSSKRTPGGHVIWLCVCSCGNPNIKEVSTKNLTSGSTKSCGCLQKESVTTHGCTGTRIYGIWVNMKARCYSRKSKYYENYGARGIKVCPPWLNNFLTFKSWALRNGYQDNLTIDRINNDGNYEPSNCQWLTKSENSKKARRDRKIERIIKIIKIINVKI